MQAFKCQRTKSTDTCDGHLFVEYFTDRDNSTNKSVRVFREGLGGCINTDWKNLNTKTNDSAYFVTVANKTNTEVGFGYKEWTWIPAVFVSKTEVKTVCRELIGHSAISLERVRSGKVMKKVLKHISVL